MIEIGKLCAIPYYYEPGHVIKDTDAIAWYAIPVVMETEKKHEIIVEECDDNKEPVGRYHATDKRTTIPIGKLKLNSVKHRKEILARVATNKHRIYARLISRTKMLSACDYIPGQERRIYVQRICRKKKTGEYGYNPYKKSFVDNYDHKYKATDPIKNFVNQFLGEKAQKFKSKSALVLDFVGDNPLHPGALVTTKILQKHGVSHIDVPNNNINYETAENATSFIDANVWPMKCNEFLEKNESARYDIMFLDFCGQLRTNKTDIQLALDRIYTGEQNQGAIFAITLFVSRTKDEKKEHCEKFIQDEFEKRDFLYEPLRECIPNGHVCTWFWLLREKTKF